MRASFPPSLGVHRFSHSNEANAPETEAVLGATHPLVALLQAARTAREQALAVATVQAASAATLLSLPRLGGALLIAASVVQLALALRRLILAETRGDLLRQLIVEGFSPSQLTALAHEWRRLADPRRRARLARSLEQLADMAERPSSYLAGARPYFNQRVIREIAPELREIGALLTADHCAVRGVALVQTLQTCGASALYRDAIQPLREQLARARYLLTTPPPEAARSSPAQPRAGDPHQQRVTVLASERLRDEIGPPPLNAGEPGASERDRSSPSQALGDG
jgi:hypothetical protein